MNPAELKELKSIKRLLIALLLKLGTLSEEIAAALRVESSAVRRMLPMKAIKKIDIIRQELGHA